MMKTISIDELHEQPHVLFKRLRQLEEPAELVDPIQNTVVMITRYEDVRVVLKDSRFSNENRYANDHDGREPARWMPSIFKAFFDSMALVDEPDHTRLRNLVHKAFTPRMIQNMEAKIETVSQRLLDEMGRKASAGMPADIMADFALPLPLTIISEMLGIPERDRLKFHGMVSTLLDPSWQGRLGRVQQGMNAFSIHRLFKRLVQERVQRPQDDLTTALVQAEEAGDKLSKEELEAMLFLLLFAGHETTVNLIGKGLLALLENQDQLVMLKENTALIDSAIEEMLRYTSPVQQVAPRFPKEDVMLHNTLIPKGSRIMAIVPSANRDETVFEEPDKFDITRSPNKHLAFGFGIHFCLGAPLARLEAKRAFQMLLAQYPDIRLAVPAEQLEWQGVFALRRLKALPVHLT